MSEQESVTGGRASGALFLAFVIVKMARMGLS